MKGLANWIMIVGSVIIGLVLFSIGASLFISQIRAVQRQGVLEQIQYFHDQLISACNMGLGNKRSYSLNLPDNLRAVYAANNTYDPPPDKVSELITDQKAAVGNHTCIQFFDDNLPICQYIGCYANMTYMGSPSMKSTLQTLLARLKGSPPNYEYVVDIEKADEYFINARGKAGIKPSASSSIPTTTTNMPANSISLIGQCHAANFLNDLEVSWVYPSGEVTWKEVEPERGIYNWNKLDQEVAKVQVKGKKIWIQVLTDNPDAEVIPQWAIDSGMHQIGDKKDKPVQWDPLYLEYLEGLIKEMSKKYDNNDVVEAVLIIGGGHFGEMVLEHKKCHGEEDADVHDPNNIYIREMAEATGETPETLTEPYTDDNGNEYVAKFDYYFIENTKKIIDIYAKYFKNKPIVIQLGSGLSCQGYVPDRVSSYGVGTYGKKFWLKQNGWGSFDRDYYINTLFPKYKEYTRIISEAGHPKYWCYPKDFYLDNYGVYCEKSTREEAEESNSKKIQDAIGAGVSAVCFHSSFFEFKDHFPVNFDELNAGLLENYYRYQD